MADDEETPQTSYEYLDGEQETTTWLSRAGKCRVTYPNGAVYEGQFNDLKQKHGLGKFPVSKFEHCPALTFSSHFPKIQVNIRTLQRRRRMPMRKKKARKKHLVQFTKANG